MQRRIYFISVEEPIANALLLFKSCTKIEKHSVAPQQNMCVAFGSNPLGKVLT